MRLEGFDVVGPLEQVDELDYLTAAPSGSGTAWATLPITRLPVRGLPVGLAGVLLSSDLQGMAPSRTGVNRLLGVVLVEHLARLADAGQIPPLAELGAILAGDLYSHPRARERGATGDVVEVWLAFAQSFRFLAGVAGNHDVLAGADYERMLRWTDVAHLDGDAFTPPGLELCIAGVSGIIGRKGKHMRRMPADFVELMDRTLRQQPDILVLHDGPRGEEPGQIGRPEISAVLARHAVPLTVRGHAYWPEPIWRHPHGVVINVDSRAIILVPEHPQPAN